MNTKKRILFGAGIIIVIIAAVLIGTYFKLESDVNAVAEDVTWENIYVEDVDVSGMTSEDIKAALEKKIAEYQAEKVILRVEEEQVEVTLGDLGLVAENMDEVVEEAVDYGKEGSVWKRYQMIKELEKEALALDVTYVVDAEVVKTVLSEKTQELGTAPQNATITRKDGAFVISEEATGVQVDVEASAEMIAAHFDAKWEPSGEEAFELVTAVKEAEVTSEALSKIKDKLGSFKTTFTSGNSRAKNIANAASRINGTVLMPGEEMSASDAMGSRTKENGYLAAGAYLNGAVIQSLGGGVCQVSTTLYNAVLNAELEITERYAHSMVVDYVPAAKDAAIAEGSKDLKFKNNTDAPIYIEGFTKGGSITFTIYGMETRAENREVKYESKTLSTTAATSKFVEASGSTLGTIKRTSSGHTGKKAELWKVVYEDGKEVSREKVNTSSYMMSPNVYSVGTASSNAEASSLVKNAISSQNRSTIDEAITKANALITAAQTPAVPETPATEAPGTTVETPTTTE